MFRRCIAPLLAALVALAWAGGALASGASKQEIVNPSGGVLADGSDGLRWWLGSNSQFQVRLANQQQVYSPTATPLSGSIFNSIYLRVDRGSNSSTRVYHNNNNASGISGTFALTQVSQSAISGSGTAASPWQVTTVLRPNSTADQGITVTIVDSYIRPQSWLTRRVTLSGMPASGAVIKFYQNIDSYLQGGDNGAGFSRTSSWNTTGRPDIVGVIKGEQFEALWYEPSSGTPHWDRYYSGYYENPARQICHGNDNTGSCTTGTGNLTNAIDTNAATDNGMAAQWNVPAGASSFIAEYRITFGMGAVDLNKAFAPATINAGGVSTLTFSLSNRTANSVSSINFTDTLPAGVVVAPTPNLRTNCPAGGALGTTFPSGMVVAAPAGSGTIQVTGGRINGAPTGGELICRVSVDVTSSVVGQHHNTTASISGTNNLVNLVGDEVLTVVQPQLTASKSVSGTLVAGQAGAAADGHYLIGLANTGSGPTTAPITLRDTLPAGFQAVAASSAQGTVNCGTLPAGGVLNCTFTPSSPIAAGASATVRIDVSIAASATGAATNTVAVAGGGDPDPLPTCPSAGNAQCAQTTQTPSRNADLQITKTNNVGTVQQGTQTAYRIVVTNPGPSNANGAVLRDPAAPGLTCTAVSCDGATNGAVCPAVSIGALQGAGVTIATLPATGTLSFTVTCTVD